MHKLSASFVLGYHGCDSSVAEQVLKKVPFKQSINDYDWLGHGAYFWEANPIRGLEFAYELKESKRGATKIKTPAVIGAVIELGLCLDLTTSAGIKQVSIAHDELQRIALKAERELPQNSENGLIRKLDCAVLETLHKMREEANESSIDTVRGVFIEGDKIYPLAGFHRKTHIQICVRNLDCIKGVFRVPDRDLASFRNP